MMILMLVCVFGSIQYISSIRCFTCNERGFFCSFPLNFDSGEESTESNINSFNYDSDYVCQADRYIDSETGVEKLILRGVKYCEELDVINRRTFCCNTNNCNKWVPTMKIQTVIYSNYERYLPSMILVIGSIVVQYLVL